MCVWGVCSVPLVPNGLRHSVPVVVVHRVHSTQSISCSLQEQKRSEFSQTYATYSSQIHTHTQGTVECWDPRSGLCVGEVALPVEEGDT